MPCAITYYYAKGSIVEKDEVEAFQWYKKAAELNDYQAQCNLALCYLNGKGTVKDINFGIYWLERAVNGGSVTAAYNLGKCYEMGLGVEKNIYFALKNYLKAANKGNLGAKIAASKVYKYEYKDYEQTIYWLNDLISYNVDEGLIELADMYISGLGVEIDEVRAAKLLEKVKDKERKEYSLIEQKIEKYIEARASI